MKKFITSIAISGFALLFVSYITGAKIDFKTAVMMEVVGIGLHYVLDDEFDK